MKNDPEKKTGISAVAIVIIVGLVIAWIGIFTNSRALLIIGGVIAFPTIFLTQGKKKK